MVASPRSFSLRYMQDRSHSSHSNEVAIEFIAASYATAESGTLVSDLNLKIRGGETMILLGRSGAGKSTTLKLINRMLDPTAGQVRVLGKPTVDWDPTQLRRRIGYVIQEIGLFPHWTVARNIETVPRLLGWERQRIATRTNELLQAVGMPAQEFRNRYPHELSGGQRQRVGLARALAADPPILIMDEPFGALDPLTRAEVQYEFRRLQEKLRKTAVIVTHDLVEALTLGDRIAVVEEGKIIGDYSREEFLYAADRVSPAYLDSLRAAEPLLRRLREQPGA
jgi:osmoprotectant transport system ATP-binding protein